ncbi:MAG: segregation and condensation protein A [Gammaproteobacteria bacterium]
MTEELSKEERILKMMKRILTDVAKDTHVTPGLKHPLSENTIQGIRECLGLITSREAELAEVAGRSMNMRPRYIDEAPKEVVVKLDINAHRKKPTS